MFREFGAFLLLFSLLGAVVHLNEIFYIFIAAALVCLAIDLMSAKLTRLWRTSKPRGEQTL